MNVSENALGLIRVAFDRGDTISEFGEDILRGANQLCLDALLTVEPRANTPTLIRADEARAVMNNLLVPMLSAQTNGRLYGAR